MACVEKEDIIRSWHFTEGRGLMSSMGNLKGKGIVKSYHLVLVNKKYGFPPSHLKKELLTGEGVRSCTYSPMTGERHSALSLESHIPHSSRSQDVKQEHEELWALKVART